jgi:hypothetical protein
MFAGKQKAWMAALVGLVSATVLQLTGSGEGPTPDQISGFAGITGEIVVGLVVAGVNYVLVYMIPNKV